MLDEFTVIIFDNEMFKLILNIVSGVATIDPEQGVFVSRYLFSSEAGLTILASTKQIITIDSPPIPLSN